MSGELVDFGARVAKIVDPATLKRILDKAGMAGKKAGLEAAADDLGGDRAFSGLRRKAPLGVGFDQAGPTAVELNFRPVGLWKLAESGRRGGKAIVPRKRGGKRAVMTPHGPRQRSTTGAWGGKGTFTAAVADARREVPRAAHRQFRVEVAKIVR